MVVGTTAKSVKLPVDYVAKIGAYGWPELQRLWTKIESHARMRGWAAGKAFEHLVLRAFQLSGADVEWPYSVVLQGAIVEQIDGLITLDGMNCMVEFKDQAANVNIEPIAKLRNQLLRRPAGLIGSVFTSGGFTDPAKTLAQYVAPQAILLWQGPEVHFLLHKRSFAGALREKYKWLMQYGQPDYDIRAGDME